jgi:glucokinase
MEKDKILTLDIGASKIRIQTIDTAGNSNQESSISIVGLELDNDKFLQLLVKTIKSVVDIENENILGIGLGIPGIIDSTTKRIEKMPNIPGVQGLDLIEELKNIFNLKIFILNDADAGALGEWWLGKGLGYKNLIYLNLGTGIGSGIIKNDELQEGSELGHNLLEIPGEQRICSCGKINCAESFIGTRGLAQIYGEIFNIEISDLNDQEIHSLSFKMREGVENHNFEWIAVLDKYTEYLALFLKNIRASYKTEIIILGGGIAFNNKPLLDAVQKKIDGQALIALAEFENASNLGIAKYGFNDLNKNPQPI